MLNCLSFRQEGIATELKINNLCRKIRHRKWIQIPSWVLVKINSVEDCLSTWNGLHEYEIFKLSSELLSLRRKLFEVKFRTEPWREIIVRVHFSHWKNIEHSFVTKLCLRFAKEQSLCLNIWNIFRWKLKNKTQWTNFKISGWRRWFIYLLKNERVSRKLGVVKKIRKEFSQIRVPLTNKKRK